MQQGKVLAMHRLRFITASVVVIVSLCLFANPVQAVVFDLSSIIDGLQTVPPTGSPGIGTGVMTYDDVSGQLDWDISWGGLSGLVTVMHFHGPAPPGSNAGVRVNIGVISGTTSPTIGSSVISAVEAADLLNDLWYINIHTAQFPGGEIRGQVLLVPEPAGMALVASGILTAGFLVRRRRRVAGC